MQTYLLITPHYQYKHRRDTSERKDMEKKTHKEELARLKKIDRKREEGEPISLEDEIPAASMKKKVLYIIIGDPETQVEALVLKNLYERNKYRDKIEAYRSRGYIPTVLTCPNAEVQEEVFIQEEWEYPEAIKAFNRLRRENPENKYKIIKGDDL